MTEAHPAAPDVFPPEEPSGSHRRPVSAAFLGWPLLGLLVIQGATGMGLNLFVSLPTRPGILNLLASQPLLDVHLLLAFLILWILGRITAVARRGGEDTVFRAAVVSVGLVGIAVLGGLDFVFGTQSSLASYAMAIGFLGAFVCAAIILASGPPGRPEPSSFRIARA